MDAKHAVKLLSALACDQESKDAKLFGQPSAKKAEEGSPALHLEPVHAHSCILSSQSSHFKALIEAERKTAYHLEKVDHAALQVIVDYMYTGEVPRAHNESYLQSIRCGAEHLGMDELAKECRFLEFRNVGGFDSCINKLLYFVENGTRPAYEFAAQHSMRYFALQMPEILYYDSFLKLSDDVVKSIYDKVQNAFAAEIRQVEFEKSRSTKIQVFVRTLCGTTIALKCKTASTVEYLKELIRRHGGIPTHSQRLIFAGRQLEDQRMLSHYKIVNECTVHLVLRLLGCLCSCSADKAEELWTELEKTSKTNAFDHVAS